jgi:S1-C subfamily serine protease
VSKIIGAICALISVSLIINAVNNLDCVPRSKSMLLRSGRGSCSGEQVKAPSGKNYILTAAHCRALENNGVITVTTEAGVTFDSKIVAEDDNSDLLLLEGASDMEGLPIAKSVKNKEEVRTFTHGHGMQTYKTSGVIIQNKQISVPIKFIESEKDIQECKSKNRNKVEIATVFPGLDMEVCAMVTIDSVMTAMIVPGSSGGMVVNNHGELVGVVSAGDGTFGYAVRLLDIQNFMSDK